MFQTLNCYVLAPKTYIAKIREGAFLIRISNCKQLTYGSFEIEYVRVIIDDCGNLVLESENCAQF